MVCVMGNRARAAIIRSRRITGPDPEVIAEPVGEVGPLWQEGHQAALASRPRRRAVGAGAAHKLVFVDRLRATLVHLRHGATHDVPACWFDVDRSTITRAISEVRPLLGQQRPYHRPWRAAADPRPRSSATSAPAGRPGSSTAPRSASVARPPDARTGTSSSRTGTSRSRQVHGPHGCERPPAVLQPDGIRKLRGHHSRPQARADQVPVRRPAVEIPAEAGYQGLGARTGGRVVTPPHRTFKRKNAPEWYEEIHEQRRKAHSPRRIPVEHGIAHLKNRRALARHHGRREHMSDTVQAVAALLSHHSGHPRGR